MQATRRSQDRCSSLDRNTALQRSLDPTTDCSGLRKSIDESLQFIRMQVDSLGLAAVSEVDAPSELVPPPPEFTAAQGGQRGGGGGGGSQCPPPSQFSDLHLHHPSRTTIPQLTPQQHGECASNTTAAYHALPKLQAKPHGSHLIRYPRDEIDSEISGNKGWQPHSIFISFRTAAQLTPQQQAAYQAALLQQQQRQQLQQQRQQLQQHHPGNVQHLTIPGRKIER